MKKNLVLRLLAVNLILTTLSLIPADVFAAFNITVRPYEGGNDLNFGRLGIVGPYTSKELIVNIDSDIGKQYQLIQTLLDPLTNERGVSIPNSGFSVYGIRGSNTSGNLSVENEVPVSIGRTIVYTSDPAGNSNSFKLVYVLKSPLDVPSGSYRGRIGFILEPIGSAQQQVNAFLNVFVEISVESGIEIKTSSGLGTISLNSARQEEFFSDVLINIKGGMGSQFNIFQSLTSPFQSTQGTVLANDAVNFKISQATKGSGPAVETPVTNRRDLVYSSGPRGEADNFIVTYSLNEPEKRKAGRYMGNIGYSLEGTASQKILGNFNLEIEIARIFDLNITPEMGGTIQFRDVRLHQPPKKSEVVIEVSSNIGKQYQVSQQTNSGLVNKEGKPIPSKYFTLRQESLDTKGQLKFSSPAEVKTGQMILFISDKEGSSDKFKVIYELLPSEEVMAGDYSGSFSYSISEI